MGPDEVDITDDRLERLRKRYESSAVQLAATRLPVS